jgi:nitrate/TMAO reductase-like tetraheme cytochrome c subunit
MKKSNKGKIIILLFILAIIGFLGGVEALHYSSEPKFCAICHPKQKPGPNGEVFSWKLSAHAKEEVECLDCHATPGVINYFIRKVTAAKDLYTQLTHSPKELDEILAHPSAHAAPEESCLFCHTDSFNKQWRSSHFMTLPTSFLKFRMLDYVENPQFRKKHSLEDILKTDEINGYAFSHKEHMENFKNLRCTSCHFEEVGHPDFSKNYALMMKKACFKCHEENDGPDNEECSTCHIVQNKIRQAEIENMQGDADVMADLECTECHKSFEKMPDKKTCIECHDGDEEYGKTLIEWKTTVKSRLDTIKLLFLKAKDKAYKDKNILNKFKNTEKLYRAVLFDRSKGVHNFEYITSILNKVEKEFKQIINKQ